MATGAALLAHRHMLESKRSCRLGMTPGADGELSGGASELASGKSSVGIVAVAALDEPDLHAMPIRSVEFSFLCRMASKAKSCLFALKQGAGFSRVMRRMA